MATYSSSSLSGLLRIGISGLWALAMIAGNAAAQESASPVRGDNYYAAGNHVEINAPMPRDVIVAGRYIDINQPVAGDILAAGWRVTLSSEARDDVRIAAAEVGVNAPVHGDVTIAAGDVTFGANAHVYGRGFITGNVVRIDGVVERDLHVAGANVELTGEIRQPVEIVAEKLTIASSAKVLAPLSYKGPSEAQIASGAVVSGPITFSRIDEREARRAHAFPTASTFLFTIHLFLAGLLVIAYLPRVETSVIGSLKAHPGKSLLMGFVLLVATPVGAALLIFSLVGLPLGLALAAVYAMALFAAVLATAFVVGDVEAKWLSSVPGANRRAQVLWLFVGVLTLAVLRAMFGGLVVFVSALFGLGALILAAYDSYTHEPVLATGG